MMSKYVRVTRTVNDRGQLFPVENVESAIKTADDEYYVSAFYYNENHYKTFKQTNTVSGINDVTTDKIWFDLDSKTDIEKARSEAIQLVNTLKGNNFKEENIQIYFSSNKGFHVVVETNRTMTPDQVKSLCINRFGKDLETLDTSVYNASRLFRYPGTKNHKSQLYKIPLTFKELQTNSCVKIKEKAKTLDNITESFDWKRAELPEEMIKVEQPKKKETKLDLSQESLNNNPKHWKNYKWQLLQGNFEIGERHNALMVVAATCRGLGYTKHITQSMLEASDKAHCEKTGGTPSTEIPIILKSIFAENWNGGQYSPDTNPWLKKYCERLGIVEEKSEVTKVSDITSGFEEFVKNIDQNTIKTGIRLLDEAMPLTTGMVCGMIGAPAAGKTAISLNILRNTSINNVPAVFASLDMHRNRLFEKLIYAETGMHRKDLYGKVQAGDAMNIYQKIYDNYKNVYFYDRSTPTVSSIRKYVEDVQESTGQKVKLLLIDYFERINSERSDETAASKDVAGQLQDLANDLNLCLIVLYQPNKFSLGGGPDHPILSYTAIKGSSFIYQSCRTIFSLWRPFFNPKWKEHDKYMQMAILKNDLGECDLFSFNWDGKRGKIDEMTEEQVEQMNILIQERKQQEAREKAGEFDL